MEVMRKRDAWNKGKLVGQKPPLKPKDIWAIRIHLQNAHVVRELAMFNLAIDRTLRGCGLDSLRVRDVTHGRQIFPRYARIVRHWVDAAGLDSSAYGTHSMRRTKATLIYKRTKNLRAVQLLLGHTKLESTVRYLGIEVDDALEISEQTEL